MQQKPWRQPARFGRPTADLANGRLRLIDDSHPQQRDQVELSIDEIRNCKRIQEYGYSSRPPLENGKWDPVIVALFGENRSDAVILHVGDRKFRIKNKEPGEVVMYDDLGNYVYLRRTKIEVKSTMEVEVNAPLVDINAEDQVTINAGDSIDEEAQIINESATTINIRGTSRVNISAPVVNISGASQTLSVV